MKLGRLKVGTGLVALESLRRGLNWELDAVERDTAAAERALSGGAEPVETEGEGNGMGDMYLGDVTIQYPQPAAPAIEPLHAPAPAIEPPPAIRSGGRALRYLVGIAALSGGGIATGGLWLAGAFDNPEPPPAPPAASQPADNDTLFDLRLGED